MLLVLQQIFDHDESDAVGVITVAPCPAYVHASKSLCQVVFDCPRYAGLRSKVVR